MTALAGKRADVYVTAGVSVSMPNEPMSDVSANVPGALVRTVYQVTNAVKRYFDPATPIQFQISLNSGGSWANVTPDFVRAGTIAFVASQQAAPAAMFRVLSGNYLPWARMAGGNEWDLNPVIDIIDVSEFMQTSHHHITALAGGTVALKRWWMDDSMRSVLGGLMVLVLFVDATTQPAGPRYEVLARMKGDTIKVPIRGAEEEAISFDIQSDVQFLSA